MSDYPSNSTAKPYFRYIDGQEDALPCTLQQMFKYEPEWAISRFRFMESRIEHLEAAMAKIVRIDENGAMAAMAKYLTAKIIANEALK